MGNYSLVEHRIVLPYDTIEGKKCSFLGIYPVCHFYCSYLSKRILRRVLIQIYVFVSPYELWHTQTVNSTQEQERPRKVGVMVESKPSRPPEGNELEIPTDGNKGQVSNPKKYRDKKQPQNKSSLEPETENDFQGRCTDLEGYTSDLGPRASDKFTRTMKELER